MSFYYQYELYGYPIIIHREIDNYCATIPAFPRLKLRDADLTILEHQVKNTLLFYLETQHHQHR